MTTKFTLAAAAALLCGTAGAASLKAPAGTDTVCAVPYFENFNDSSKVLNPNNLCDYKGWTIFGASGNTKRFKVRTNSTLSPAGDGMYLVNSMVFGARNDWAISPAVTLKAGKQYAISCKVLATGGTNSLKEHLRITVGKDTTEAAQGTVLLDLPQANYKEWTVLTAEFTPDASGNYYFGFNNCTEQRGYAVAIDDVSVTAADSHEAVAAFDMPTGGVYTKENELLLYPDTKVTFTNRSQNATSYLWTTGGIPATTTEKNAEVSYAESGTYEVTLLASNENSDSLATASLNVLVANEPYMRFLKTSAPTDSVNAADATLSTLSTSTEYKAGYNSRYTKFAERFNVPEQSVISGVLVEVTANKYGTSYPLYHTSHPVVAKLVADSLGLPCESQELGRATTTLEEQFGTEGANGIVSSFVFDDLVKISGPFHVVFDFGSAKNSLTDYLALRSYTHAAGATSTFTVCTASGWTSLKTLTGNDADTQFALDAKVFCTVDPRAATGVTAATATAAKVSVSDRTVTVSGIEPGAAVRAYNMQGTLVATAKADTAGTATLDASQWPAAAYAIATPAARASKVLIK